MIHLKKPDKIIFVDIEASCWSSDKEKPKGEQSEIIEIGICLLDKKDYSITESRSIYIKPTISTVSNFCTELTGITQSLLDKEGISFQEACDILRKDYHSRERIWCSYGEYDKKMFVQQCVGMKIPYPFTNQHVNIKALMTLIRDKTLGLDEAVRFINREFQGKHHSGKDDAINVAVLGKFLFIKLLNNSMNEGG